ncbi:MAG: SpoIIE family protein phosphatase [Verrucomicrobiota bacterium]
MKLIETDQSSAQGATPSRHRLFRMKVVYGIALTFIAVTIVSSALIMLYALKRNEGDSRVINLSGRQRMLSQRLTKCVLAMEREPAAATAEGRPAEIEKSLKDWMAAHEGLQYGNPAIGLPVRENSPEIRSLFQKIENPYRDMVQAVTAVQRLLAAKVELRGNPELKRASSAMLAREPFFLQLMDQITFQFDAEAKARIQGLKRLELAIPALGLLVLLLEFLIVFHPSLAQLSTMVGILEKRGEELTKANADLKVAMAQAEAANEQVRESINYARTIQQALLPPPRQMQGAGCDYFVIWSPRDVIGGDLYWLEERGGDFTVAAIDCTGHGVAGAILTMLAGSVLHRAVSIHGNRSPARLLAEMNHLIRLTLSREAKNTLSDDGLDMAICHVSRSGGYLEFAGARQSLFYVRGAEVVEVKGDNESIGYQSSAEHHQFQNHRVPLAEVRAFYLTTDGLLGQVGAASLLPFGKNALREFIAAHHAKPFAEQRQLLSERLTRHMGGETQRDDITVMGFGLERPGNFTAVSAGNLVG